MKGMRHTKPTQSTSILQPHLTKDWKDSDLFVGVVSLRYQRHHIEGIDDRESQLLQTSSKPINFQVATQTMMRGVVAPCYYSLQPQNYAYKYTGKGVLNSLANEWSRIKHLSNCRKSWASWHAVNYR